MRTHSADIKNILPPNVHYWLNRSQVTAHYDVSKDNFIPKHRDQFAFNVEKVLYTRYKLRTAHIHTFTIKTTLYVISPKVL